MRVFSVDKQHGQCSKGASCSLSHDTLPLETVALVRDEKGRSSSPASNSKAKTDGEGQKPSKESSNEEEALQIKGTKFHADSEFVKTRHVKFGILRCVKNYKSETGCTFGRTCFFRHVEAEEKPSKKSKKGGAKGSVALLKESTHLGCVSQDSYPRKSFLREEGKLGSKHAVKFSKGT